MTELSSAARATYDAFNRVGLYSEPTFETDRKALAAAIRAVANEVVPETPSLFAPWSTAVDWELLKKEHCRNESIRVHQCLMSIADELEGIKYGTYRCPVPK
jgi:hypothetical protein